ncbi:MAG: 4Fe-4S dicluster domain-containing protein [Bacillota bacterium]|nr:4Fe-4S ferredoxin [Bacillota bacterium]HWR56332.1 4Fe-4S dicluster domain-containing protein [Negativicutes bacterium]
MKRIIIDKSLCMGCQNCTIGCMSEHSGGSKSIYALNLTDPANEGRNHISLDQVNQPTPIFCRHCDEPECVTACMTGAMTKNEATGVVTYDKEHCAACFMCVMSCPYGVLKPSACKENKVLRCDLCGDREIPRCVEDCPTEALRFVEVNS